MISVVTSSEMNDIKKSHSIFISANMLMQFYLIDNCRRILIAIIDPETGCCITLLHNQVLKLIKQIKQLDEINIYHPNSWNNQETNSHCNAFSISRHVYSSRIVITTTKWYEEFVLDDATIMNLIAREFLLKAIIQDLQSEIHKDSNCI